MTVLGRKGGMDRVADLIASTITQRQDIGIQITRLTTRGSRGFLSGAFIFGFALARLWFASVRGEVDVLHIHVAARGSAYRKLILARIARYFGIPYIVHLHGSTFHEFWASIDGRTRKAVDRMFRESAKIIVLGRFWSRLVADNVNGVQDKIVILPNATRRIANGRTPAIRPKVQITCLGNLGSRKGTPQLIDALARIANCDEWTATIAGDGDVSGSRTQAAQLEIADRVSIPGWVDSSKVDDILRRTDMLVLPSFAENLPMAILEGFAHGIAVVATPVGAIPEVIEHDRNGLIVPAGDVDALAAAMRRLIADADLRHRLGAAAQQDHAKQYDINRYVTRLAVIWRDAAEFRNELR